MRPLGAVDGRWYGSTTMNDRPLASMVAVVTAIVLACCATRGVYNGSDPP
jgi:hypothetical protein